MIFGADWPGVPGPRKNAEAVASLGLDPATHKLVCNENARKVYRLAGRERLHVSR